MLRCSLVPSKESLHLNIGLLSGMSGLLGLFLILKDIAILNQGLLLGIVTADSIKLVLLRPRIRQRDQVMILANKNIEGRAWSGQVRRIPFME